MVSSAFPFTATHRNGPQPSAQADGDRGPPRLGIAGPVQGDVEFELNSIGIAVRHPASDSRFVDLHIEAYAFVHLDGERLRATHAAHPARQDQSTFQGPAEVL